MEEKGLFFDLDGTLAESLEVMRWAYDHVLDLYGAKGSDKEFESLNGPPLDEIAKRLIENHGLKENPTALVAQYITIIHEKYLNVKPSQGAHEVLALAKKNKWKTAVVTSSNESLALEWLTKNNLENFFEVIVGRESVRNGKPSPEPYILATKKTGVLPKNSMAVEDSVGGLRSALEAGLSGFFFNPGSKPTPSHLKKFQMITNLTDLIPWL
jgi:HAD superfamily hydrolase (TIGR01509 family)